MNHATTLSALRMILQVSQTLKGGITQAASATAASEAMMLLLNHLDGLTRCKQNWRGLIMPAAAAAGTR